MNDLAVLLCHDTSMRKCKDKMIELIETKAKNSHHNEAKPFRRGIMPKVQFIDAKSPETCMLLEKIEKMVEVWNLLLDRLIIQNGYEGLAPVLLQEASPCANCSRLDHIELDCSVMVVQEQGI